MRTDTNDDLIRLWHENRERSLTDYTDARLEYARTGNSQPTIHALAYAWAHNHWRTFGRLLAAADEQVRRQCQDMMPADDEDLPTEVEIGAGWIASTQRAESNYGQYVYVAEHCAHGEGVVHSLRKALACGMLRDVARARGHNQVQVAWFVGCHPQSVVNWWHARKMPTGKYREALERYLMERATNDGPTPASRGTQLPR